MEAQVSLVLSQINQAVSSQMYQYDATLLLKLLEDTFKKLEDCKRIDPDIVQFLRNKENFRTKKAMNDFVKRLTNEHSLKKRIYDTVKENAKLLTGKGYSLNELVREFQKQNS